MRALLFTVFLLLGCGARFIDDPLPDAGTAGVSPPGGDGPGCPLNPPTSGQACSATSGIKEDNFYCHYFKSEDACAQPDKCSNQFFSGPFSSPNCRFKASACVAGAECGDVFERDGACIVACKRVCKCSGGALRCTSISC